eukprot:TRINITY_DN8096_c0_g1_i3.p1 TRINITY_DN8096_c0_g1~~TRINITY_DN8096_c0_g1_i3.p1  ORF type:complete len:245 (-),score=36.33 TRINITY_DN8096_c0_g1_i3:177-911(-)
MSGQQYCGPAWPYGVPAPPLPIAGKQGGSLQNKFDSTQFIYNLPNVKYSSFGHNAHPNPVQLPNIQLAQGEAKERGREVAKPETALPTAKDSHHEADPDQAEEHKSSSENSSQKRFTVGQAYDYRNVYKSVIRHLYNFTKTNKKKLREILKSKGYEDKKIRIAFETIRQYRPPDRPKDIERKSQYRIEQIIKAKSIFTFILKETLVFMLDKWEDGEFGQLFEANTQLYVDACKKLLDEVNRVLS